MKHWILGIALACFCSPARALSVRTTAGTGAGETNTYTSTKTFTSTVQISSAVITYVQASSITVVVPSNGVGNAFSITNGTFTVAATGIVSAPSQPGARVDTLSMANNYIQRAVFWQLYWTNSSGNGSYNQNRVFKSDAVSSDTFKARGAGLYYVSVKIGSIQNTGTNNTMKVYISVNGVVKSEKMNVPPASGTWSATCEDYLLLADGDNVTAKVYSDETTNNPVPTNNNTTNSMVLQKIW